MSERSIVELTFAFYPKGHKMLGEDSAEIYGLFGESKGWKKPYEDTTRDIHLEEKSDGERR